MCYEKRNCFQTRITFSKNSNNPYNLIFTITFNDSMILIYMYIQLLHLNEINMRFYGAEYNNIERGEAGKSTTISNEAKPSSILLYSAP